MEEVVRLVIRACGAVSPRVEAKEDAQ